MSAWPETELDDAQDAAAAAASRRGPMRPRRLVSVRASQSRRLSSHVFRAVDLIAIIAVTVVMCQICSPAVLLSTPIRQVLPLAIGAGASARALLSLRLYRFVRSESLPAHMCQVLIAVGAGAAVAFGLGRLIDRGSSVAAYWQWTAGIAGTILVLHFLWWLLVHAWREGGWLTPNLVIVGATTYGENVISEALARGHVNVLGVFDDRFERSPQALLGVPVLGDVSALLTHKLTPFVDRIVIAVEPTAVERVRQIAARLSVLPNEVSFFLAEDESTGRSAALAQLEDSPLAELNGTDAVARKAFAKRVQDLALGIPLLLVFSPLIAVLALAIKIDSRGPVFFRQRRHGFINEEILVCKFRTMRQEAADARAERQVSADDDRVTRVGRVLRKTGLDELPQLLNVVRGEMSLVGPRPHAIGMKTGEIESARLVEEYAHRHRIKPGMTGWAAIHGSRGPLHSQDEVQRRVALDIDYIGRQTFLLDLKIMVKTVPTMLGDRHAVR